MTHPQSDSIQKPLLAFSKSNLFTYTVEWLIWVTLAGILYAQTAVFDQPIAEYAFGASGWPRVICLAVILGASCQLIFQIIGDKRRKIMKSTMSSESVNNEFNLRRDCSKTWYIFAPTDLFILYPQFWILRANSLFHIGFIVIA